MMLLAQAAALLLACDGVGEVPTTDTANVTGFQNGEFRTGRVTVHSSTTKDLRVMVEILGDTGRIRLPEELVPYMRSRSDEGWRPLNDLRLTREQMEGSFVLGLGNRPHVVIDRLTGELRIRGTSLLTGTTSFDGVCRPVEAPTEPLF
ncbi:MAG TPA: hypothetical protein VGN74_02530 [Brevundimonas sp.]|jgi:hypothetical protein|uniref:hypothetical protein n=1 Tax=Brevundimonas sp. TaxID=1871086 RepID=UPI002E1593B2|nr:hypothetical protein [Brevundimonas sp.]